MEFKKKFYINMLLFLALALVFLYGLTIYPHSPYKPSGASLEAPSRLHILGTDNLGIDIYAQLSKAFFHSILLGLISSLLATILGGSLGYLAGYYGGRLDNFIMFIVDIFMGVPRFPIMILLGVFLSQTSLGLMVIIILFSWAAIAKIVRGTTFREVNKDYIKIARIHGGGPIYILKNHLSSQIIPLTLINGIKVVGDAIVMESSLAFVGLVDPTKKTLGLMINRAMNFKGIYFTDFWKWWMLPPIVSLLIITYNFRLISKWIQISRKEVLIQDEEDNS